MMRQCFIAATTFECVCARTGAAQVCNAVHAKFAQVVALQYDVDRCAIRESSGAGALHLRSEGQGLWLKARLAGIAR